MIEALCTPATTSDGFDVQADRWREEALKDALPALLARTRELHYLLDQLTATDWLTDAHLTGPLTDRVLPLSCPLLTSGTRPSE